MLSLAAFKVFIYAVFGVAWVSVLYIFVSALKDIRTWFTGHRGTDS